MGNGFLWTLRKQVATGRRDTLWRIMGTYGIPPYFTWIVQALAEKNKCATDDGSNSYDWFDVETRFI